VSRSTTVATALVASVGLHLLVVLAVPGVRVRLPIGTSDRLVEVELQREPEPPPLETPAPPEPSPTVPLTPEAAEALGQELMQHTPRGAAPPQAPPLRLPERATLLPEPDTLPWSPSPTWETEPLPQPENPTVRATPGPDLGSATALAESLLKETTTQAAPVEEPIQAAMRRLEIEGPVGVERRVLKEPPPPRVPICNPASVAIKFFVSPRGEVTRAFPTQRGDPELDRAALAYIKSFRFNALPPGEEQEQWGTIRVRFRLE